MTWWTLINLKLKGYCSWASSSLKNVIIFNKRPSAPIFPKATDYYPKKMTPAHWIKKKNYIIQLIFQFERGSGTSFNLTQIHTCLYVKLRPKFEFEWLILISKECTCHVQLKLALWPTFSTWLSNEVLLFCN